MSGEFNPDAWWERLTTPLGLYARRPDFRFDPDFYSGRYPQVAQSGLDPRAHFDAHGQAEGLAPTQYAELRAAMPNLDRRVMTLIRDPQLRVAVRDGAEGAAELAFELLALGDGIDRQLSDFSAKLYTRLYPDIAEAGLLPLGHFLRHGEREGRRSLRQVRENFMHGSVPYDPEKPTCLICVHEFSRTGAPIVGLDLVRSASATHNVLVGTLHGGELSEKFREHAVAVFISDRPEMEFDFVLEGGLTQIDFAILNSVVAFRFLSFCSARNIPVAMYLHEYAEYILPRHHAIFSGLLSDQLVFSSNQVLNSWRPYLEDIGFDVDRDTTIIPQAEYERGTITEESRRAAQERLSHLIRRDVTGKRVVFGAGHAHWRKGTDMFALTAQLSRETDPDTIYVWIGNGLNPEEFHFGVWADQHLREAGVNTPDGNLFTLPAGDYFEDVCRASDVLFLSSRLDPLPNVVFDAARLGCQVMGFSNASGFDDPEYLEEPGLHMVPFGRLDLAAQKLSSLPLKPDFQAGLEPREAEDLGSIFDRIRSHLESSLAAQRRAVIGRGEYDLPVMFSTDPEDAQGRRAERQKIWSLGRRFVWKSRSEAQAFLDASDNWLHDAIEVRAYSDAAAPMERDGLADFGIHVHAYHLEGLDEDIAKFAAYRLASTVVATTDTVQKQQRLHEIFANHGIEAQIELVKNQGRDILPFLRLFKEDGAGQEQDIWLHIHQKKAPSWGQTGGEVWRQFLTTILMGEYGRLSDALSLISSGEAGLVAPFDPYRVGWGGARALFPEVANGLAKPLPDQPGLFPVGNMFWTRREVAQSMRDLFGADYPWPNEPIANDGTIYHLIERLWPTMAASCGKKALFLDKPDQARC